MNQEKMDVKYGDGFIMTPPGSAKDRVFGAVMRRVNALFREAFANAGDETAREQALYSLRQYVQEHDLLPEDFEIAKINVEPTPADEDGG